MVEREHTEELLLSSELKVRTSHAEEEKEALSMSEENSKRNQIICMLGTDHDLASAEVRSVFSLPAELHEDVLALARVKLGATGVVLLTTCNRTELWVSFDGVTPPVRSLDERGVPREDDPLLQVVCDMHMVDAGAYAQYFVARSGEDAVAYLFQVACGLRSAIMAEDQIVSQVKNALAFSREIGVTDSVLEVLFRQAVTAAKQVKSGVRFTRAYATAIDQAIAMLEESGTNFRNTTCMVIGNGEYGRLAASALIERGAKVFVTVRQYTRGSVTVPHGCESIPYAQRYEYIERCAVVMSATTSPHFTLDYNRLIEACSSAVELTFIDLALPHDIDPLIAELPACKLYDIDNFATHIGAENTQSIEAAQRILVRGEREFWDWMDRRDALAQTKPPLAMLFPLFVDLSEKRAVFIGGGTIALRRVRTLLPFVGDIVIYAPEFTPELVRFADDGAVKLVQRAYEPTLLDGADIAFVCTNNSELNDEIWTECKRREILVNVCSDRFKCDFYFPGVVQSEEMVVGVSAGGKNHRRVRQVSARIRKLLEEEDL